MCGIVGVFNHPEASNLVYLGLHALQHRGQEAAGIVSSDGRELHVQRGQGLVSEIYDENNLQKLPGLSAIGHTRYSTAGESSLRNAQPIVINYAEGWLACGHNGNLVHIQELRAELEARGSIFQTSTDTEVLVHLIAASKKNSVLNRIIEALSQVQGAYSLVLLTENRLIAARDPFGWRPLVIGSKANPQVPGGVSWFVASESCALSLVGAQLVREVEPGEIVTFDANGMESHHPFTKPPKRAMCVFEFVYFARPDSQVFGRSIYEMRKALGRQLAIEQPAAADIVIPVPDSGSPAALGYAEQSGIPYQMGLVRNHYIGRTFIEPKESIRSFGVKIKLSPNTAVLKDKRVVVVDDSIVRGTTSKKIIHMIREAGAKEIHLRISSPPTTDACYFGIDTPKKEDLIASSHSVEEMREFIGADSLGFLSREGLFSFKKKPGEWFCDACFSGEYPISVVDVSEPPKRVAKG